MRSVSFGLMLFVAAVCWACGPSASNATPPAAGEGAKAAGAPSAAAGETKARQHGSWIGAAAPEITVEQIVQGPPGAVASLDAFKGKVIVLAFWSTHCPTCPKVIPLLNSLVDKFKDRPVQFLSVINESEQDVRDFLKTMPVKTWIALDKDISMTKDYFIMGVPMVAIVNAEGVLCAKSHPFNLTEQVIEDALAGRTPKMELPPTPEALLKDTPFNQLPVMELMLRQAEHNAERSIRRSGGLRMRGVTLREVIQNAYIVDQQMIVSPNVLLDAKYDVTIVPPEGREHEAAQILRDFLETSMGIKTRQEEQKRKVWVLKKPAGGELAPGMKPAAQTHPDAKMSDETGELSLSAAPVQALAYYLFAGMRFKAPVIDETKMDGNFDVTLKWDPIDPMKIPFAVKQQLGLELVEEERPLHVLVVERPAK